jgi:hypothetical protein
VCSFLQSSAAVQNAIASVDADVGARKSLSTLSISHCFVGGAKEK